MLFFRVTRSAKSESFCISHGSSKPGKRSFGRFSRPLLEVYFGSQNQCSIIAKSLAVAEVNPLLQGISTFIERFCLLEQKYKRGLNHKLLFEIDGQYNQELGTVCSIVGGGTPDTLRPEYWGGNVEWFTPSEIGKSKYVLSSLRKISRIGLSNSSAKLLPAGTVLLTTRATLGEMSIARSECSTNQGFQSLIADSKRILPEYLYYLQILIKPWCEKYASGNTFREISKVALSKCIVPVPDLNEQAKIVNLLSRVDDLINAQEQVGDALTQAKEGLLQQLFI